MTFRPKSNKRSTSACAAHEGQIRENHEREFTDSSIFKWLAGIGIPIANTLGISFSGWLITSSIERAKIDIALSILTRDNHAGQGKDKNPPSTEEELALRSWAVLLLNGKSPEKFTAGEQNALLKGGIRGLGISLGVSGALQLKAHAENPAQERLAPGIARMLAEEAIDNNKVSNSVQDKQKAGSEQH